MCFRCNQTEYHAAKELDDELKEKQVHCLAADCTFKCPLRYYLRHSHGRMNYSNADVDFGRIQTEQRHFIPLPSLAVLEADNVAAGAASMRQQLMQVNVDYIDGLLYCYSCFSKIENI